MIGCQILSQKEVDKMRILWLSRHVPQEAQVAALRERFGDIEIVRRAITLHNNPRAGADEVERLLAEVGAIEMVGVLPIPHLAEVTQRGIHPIRAIMTRTPTGSVLPNGEIEYNFDFERFERVIKIEVVTEKL